MPDQTSILQGYLDNSNDIDFDGEEFEVAGTVVIPSNASYRNFKINATGYSSNRTVVKVPDATNLSLEKMSIDLGTDPTQGNISTSQALWVQGGKNAVFSEIEVTGKGKGSPVRLQTLTDSIIKGLHIHDITWQGSETSETIMGLWLVMCQRLKIESPRISKLLKSDGRPYQTDGITSSGSVDCDILDPDIEFCGEGIDITGSLVNKRIRVMRHAIRDCDSFGIKLANAPQFCEVLDGYVERAGYAAYVISGMSEAGNTNRAHSNAIRRCTASDTGSSYWAHLNTAHVSIMQGSYLTTLPTNNVIEDVIGYGLTNKYGALTQTAGNVLRGFTCCGQTVAKTLGTWI